MDAKSTLSRVHDKKPSFWNLYFLPTGLPLLLALVLGLLLAALITSENWLFALLVLFSVPMAMLINKYPFAAIMIWMAVMPWFPFDDVYKYVYFTVHRFLIPLALAYNLFSRMLSPGRHSKVKMGLADLAMVAFVTMGIISMFVSGRHWKWLFTLQDRSLIPFMAYWLVRFSNAQKQDLKRLVPLILSLNLAECVIGLVSWFAPQVIPSIWRSGLLGDRIVGTFRQPGAYACILLFFLVFLYHEAMNRKRGRARTFLMLAFCLGMVCVFFTFTRSAWAGGLFVLLGLLYLYPKATTSLIAVIVPIMLILSIGVLANEFAHANDRLFNQDTAEDRVILANAGKSMFYARPVFGWGYASYDLYDWKFMESVGNIAPTQWQIKTGTSHNTFLTVLAEMGAVGFFLLYFPVAWWLGLTIKALPRLPKEGFWSQRLLLVMWLPIGVYLLISQGIDMRFFYYCATLFWINLGFVANMVQTCLQSVEPR